MTEINRAQLINALAALDKWLSTIGGKCTAILYGGAAAVFYNIKPITKDVDLLIVSPGVNFSEFERQFTQARFEFFLLPPGFQSYLNCSKKIPVIRAGMFGPTFRLVNLDLRILPPVYLALSFIRWRGWKYSDVAVSIIKRFGITAVQLETANKLHPIATESELKRFIKIHQLV